LLKPNNPFEGIPLGPDFPKTPLSFWKGHVVGELRIVVTDYVIDTGGGLEKRGGERVEDYRGVKGGESIEDESDEGDVRKCD
jgi:hypothetical protein